MEDYILREINRIGELIAALLDKIGLLKKSGAPELIRETAKTELAEQLDLDIDTLLAGEDFIATLVGEYGFSDADLEKFAELLFDFAAASEERGGRPQSAHSTATSTRRRRPHRSTATTSSRIWTNTSKNLNKWNRKNNLHRCPKTLTGNSNRAKSTRPSCPPRRRPAR